MVGTGSRARVPVRGVLAAALAVVAVVVIDGDGAPPLRWPSEPQVVPQVASPVRGTLPIVAEHRYRIAGKIRPLLLFWIGKDGVGSARLRWRRGEGDARGYDMLIGSDPARAPRAVNRWGYILEEVRGGEATIVGVMKKSDEESLDEATSRVATEAKGGVVFKMIQATVRGPESVAKVTATTMARDYSYRELDALVDALVKEPSPPKFRTTRVPPDGRPGLLSSIVELVHDAVDGMKTTGRAPGRRSLAYVYYAKQYDLARTSSHVERNATYGGVTYPKLLNADFEVTARGESWTERFTLVCGIDGTLAEVPVFMTYQPRWWFKVELVLDEREAF
jgi:hypothetical protein